MLRPSILEIKKIKNTQDDVKKVKEGDFVTPQIEEKVNDIAHHLQYLDIKKNDLSCDDSKELEEDLSQIPIAQLLKEAEHIADKKFRKIILNIRF